MQRHSAEPVAPWLLQLDRAGFLQRELRWGARAWAQVQPQRAPDGPPPDALPPGTLQLAEGVLIHPGLRGPTLEAPGGWARVLLLRPGLLALLDGLARGCSLARAEQLVPDAPGLVAPLLQMWAWCGLLAGSAPDTWAAQDLLFYSRSRRGFGRGPVGKQASASHATQALPLGPRLRLTRGQAADLPASLDEALSKRQSLREHGAKALPRSALDRFLWHTLAVKTLQGREQRPYPSGGRCYALQAFLVVAHCADLDAGLYAYDAQVHELILLGSQLAGRQALIQDAASSAQCGAEPHLLLVLCADYPRMRAAYGDLGYSLLLKEVGTVMQTAQLVAGALGLACCPLGTGDALQFAKVSGTDVKQWPAVGELLLGAPT